MKLYFIALFVTCLVHSGLAQDSPAKESAEGLLSELQGSWQLVPDNFEGKSPAGFFSELPEPNLRNCKIHFEGNRMFLVDTSHSYRITNEIRMDGVELSDGHQLICYVTPGGDGRAYLGTYRVSGEKLELKFPHDACLRATKTFQFVRISTLSRNR